VEPVPAADVEGARSDENAVAATGADLASSGAAASGEGPA
jgi:hypothetical protein